ncbi:MAG: 3'-5' exonuclease [Bacteroidales bacterium]|nr:3'-5' exonuclease [Bacteroidales bacterium]
MFKVSIDKTEINSLPTVQYTGEVVVIDSMLKVKAAVNVLRNTPLVGFDTETRPSFRKGEHHKMALIQLSTPDICFLFRVNKIGVPTALAEYLADANCAKVGLSTHDDFRQLAKVCDVQPAGFIEIQKMVGQYHITDISLQKIYAILFQQRISKSQRLTNWECATLTEPQQRYAAIDAWACVNIYNRLTSGEFNPEASPYRKEITDEE